MVGFRSAHEPSSGGLCLALGYPETLAEKPAFLLSSTSNLLSNPSSRTHATKPEPSPKTGPEPLHINLPYNFSRQRDDTTTLRSVLARAQRLEEHQRLVRTSRKIAVRLDLTGDLVRTHIDRAI